LLTLLRRNADSEYGRRFGFASIANEREYRTRVPVAAYEDLWPLIERMTHGEQGVLVSDHVIAFEETGGSTAGPKLVPHTSASLAGFRRALLPWLDDLAQAYPTIKRGRAYWAISHVARSRRATPAGIPIGLSDLDYFGAQLAPLASQLLAVPPSVGTETDFAKWRTATRRLLRDCADLTLISVWSPTFLEVLFRHGKMPSWPHLKVISCWDHGSSRGYAQALRRLFPQAHVQGKGLLATEGAVSVPLHGHAMPVLAVDSGFFEFQDDAGRIVLPAECRPGGEYQVILTTEGGLYRYALGDRVRVHGFSGEAPLLEFLGRGALVSDLCGEKLTEPFVLAALLPLGLRFSAVAPDDTQSRRYVLYVDADEVSAERASGLAAQAEGALQSNPQYAYARLLGQLAPLQVRRCRRPIEAWQEAGVARGQRLGDIKPPALCVDRAATARFAEVAR
jgi:hypothetical protein